MNQNQSEQLKKAIDNLVELNRQFIRLQDSCGTELNKAYPTFVHLVTARESFEVGRKDIFNLIDSMVQD